MQALQAVNAGAERHGRCGPERIAVRVSGKFTSEASLKDEFPLQRPLLPAG
jgi:hypothetical protein